MKEWLANENFEFHMLFQLIYYFYMFKGSKGQLVSFFFHLFVDPPPLYVFSSDALFSFLLIVL